MFGAGATAVETDLCVCTVETAAVVFGRLLRVLGVGEEGATELVRDRG